MECSPQHIILMKYGVHASEQLDSIMSRKIAEIDAVGNMFWGYSGTLCHPTNQVQEYLRQIPKDEKLYLLLSETKSPNHSIADEKRQFSNDGVHWLELPDSIRVVGSKYALVCTSLVETEMYLNTSDYKISVGPSAGKRLKDYFRCRVDKACATYDESPDSIPSNVRISWIAEVADAVFVR